MQWIDIGVNLTNKRFDQDRELVIQEAFELGVKKQILTGTNLDESQKAYQLTQQYPKQLYSTAGCHPHDAKNFSQDDYQQISKLLENDSVVAVGECGLDFNRNFSPPDIQIEVFTQQLELAIKHQKPVFLHERDAFDQQFEILSHYIPKLKSAVVHCFTGTKEELEKYIELGLFIGITGWVCDERRGLELKNILHLIPNNKLMIETDAPYLLPRDLRPKPKSSRNLPKYLPHIAKTIAEVRKTSLENLSMQCYTNTVNFFGLPE